MGVFYSSSLAVPTDFVENMHYACIFALLQLLTQTLMNKILCQVLLMSFNCFNVNKAGNANYYWFHAFMEIIITEQSGTPGLSIQEGHYCRSSMPHLWHFPPSLHGQQIQEGCTLSLRTPNLSSENCEAPHMPLQCSQWFLLTLEKVSSVFATY